MNTENELQNAPAAIEETAAANQAAPTAEAPNPTAPNDAETAVAAPPSNPTHAEAENDDDEDGAGPGRKWREGRIVDAAVRVWDAAARTGIADVVSNSEDEPPISVFLVGDLFAATDLSPQPGDVLRGVLQSHPFGGHWLLDSAENAATSSLQRRSPEEEEALFKERKQAKRQDKLVNGETYVGKVVRWRDEEQAGYIKVKSIKARVFFPQSAFVFRDKRPAKHQQVSFVLGRRRGEWVATRVIPQGYELGWADRESTPSGTVLGGGFSETLLGSAFILLYLAAVSFISLPLASAYLLASCLLLILYRTDKRSAQNGRARVPDAVLHLLAVLGGWPGGLMAQMRYQHHTANIHFVRTFWFSVALNAIGSYLVLVYLINLPAFAFLKN
ncbi:DUF1294 domain-containing protein [Eikenella sp. S3360]|uniref:DUF1294 domain-containing protein n=2 Tax=Eikenella glucosivorans TaxID=2766967 RepID=A0ABS0N9R5_9NEIS|nr:DUF1294 domain-containing protein [Eikenella glucosivorans]